MKKPASPEAYLAAAPDMWRSRLRQLRQILCEREELTEAIKWAFPVYSLGKKNIASLFHTKAYVGVWFSQGALLADPNGLLINASPGKTVAQRQLRFGPDDAVSAALVRGFLAEAIGNAQLGLEVSRQPAPAPELPERLKAALDTSPKLAQAFANFPPYKQREFCESITSAKREATKERRLATAIDMILAGKGLSDKYRK